MGERGTEQKSNSKKAETKSSVFSQDCVEQVWVVEAQWLMAIIYENNIFFQLCSSSTSQFHLSQWTLQSYGTTSVTFDPQSVVLSCGHSPFPFTTSNFFSFPESLQLPSPFQSGVPSGLNVHIRTSVAFFKTNSINCKVVDSLQMPVTVLKWIIHS